METNKNIGLTFVNYNYAFNQFYESYKQTCLIISQKTLISEIKDIHKVIGSFVCEYEYAIRDKDLRKEFTNKLLDIKNKLYSDEELRKIITLDFNILKNRLNYHIKYYDYLLLYLDLLGKFISELTTTFMPNTNLEKKILKFSNNQVFFEKFTQHKQIVSQSLTEFSILEFNKGYNQLLTFYYAYSLFINNEQKIIIEKLFTIALSLFLNKETIKLLNNYSFSKNMSILRETENRIHEILLFINS